MTILAPHLHAADELLRTIVAESGSRFGVRRFTPNQLAARLAEPELARRGAALGTSLSLTALITRATHALHKDGRLGQFSAAARTPGFPHAVARTFQELRAARIPSRTLDGLKPSGAELAALCIAVEHELDHTNIADRATIYDLAIAALETQNAVVGKGSLLLLDLALDTELERSLIAALVARSPGVLATAAETDNTARSALTLVLKVPDECVESQARVIPGSLARLQRHLFAESLGEEEPPDGSVSLMSWQNETRECVEIARALHAHAARGIPFDRMAIFLRSPSLYRAHIVHALRRASIPAWLARGLTQPDPSGRALLALLACKAEGLSARRFAEYLSLAQMPSPTDEESTSLWSPPEHDLVPLIVSDDETPREAPSPATAGYPRAPWRWERLLVDASVIGGEDRWRRRLRGLAEELALRRTQLEADDPRLFMIDRTRTDLEDLEAFALPLIARLAQLPRAATWNEWLRHLRDLTAVAIKEPGNAIAILTEFEPLGAIGPVDIEIVRNVLSPKLRELTIHPTARPEGAVFVAPVDMARGLEFDVVFVPGLAVKVFPQPILPDPLLSDEARDTLGSATLPTQQSRIASERLALRLVTGAATRHLSLSWPRTDDEKGRARVPSFYALDARRAAEGRLPSFDELRASAETGASARLGWPAPDKPERAIDDTEYDLAVLAHLTSSDPAESEGAAAYLLSANPHLARALRARAARWRKRWFPSDGLVDSDPQIHELLMPYRIGIRPYAPTTLESYAVCPYRFFLQAIHRLKPREEIAVVDTLEPLTRGAFVHEAQFRLLTALRDEGQLPVRLDTLERAFERLDAIISALAATYAERLAPAIPRVWQDGIEWIRVDLREWLRRAIQSGIEWVPHRFELAFGLPNDARPNADPASTTEPVQVLDNVLLHGSIDVVERRADTVLRVIEHKTRAADVNRDAIVAGGEALQPLLYALSAETLLRHRVESGHLYYCTSDGEFTDRRIPLNDSTRRDLKRVVDVIARSIEQGWFPAAPRKDACRWCNYRPVCGPHEEDRVQRKAKDRLEDLEALRKLT